MFRPVTFTPSGFYHGACCQLGFTICQGYCYDSCCDMQQEADEEEEEQEILALPAPGDDLSQEGQLEAEMHAAIASAELADYAQVPPPSPPTPPPKYDVKAASCSCMQTCYQNEAEKQFSKMILRSYAACRLRFPRLNYADPHEQQLVQPRDNLMQISPLSSHPSSRPHRLLKMPPQPSPRLPIQKVTPNIRMLPDPSAASLQPPVMLIPSLSKLACCRLVMKTLLHCFSHPALQSKHMLRALRVLSTLHHRMRLLP